MEFDCDETKMTAKSRNSYTITKLNPEKKKKKNGETSLNVEIFSSHSISLVKAFRKTQVESEI